VFSLHFHIKLTYNLILFVVQYVHMGYRKPIKNWDLCSNSWRNHPNTNQLHNQGISRFIPLSLWAHHILCLRFRLHSGAGILYIKWHSLCILGGGSADGYPHTVQGTPDPRFSASLLMKQSLSVRSVFLFATRDQYITTDLGMIMFSSFLNNFSYHFESLFCSSSYSCKMWYLRLTCSKCKL
jgi:hypothetical protein